jgi:hypothetical protein
MYICAKLELEQMLTPMGLKLEALFLLRRRKPQIIAHNYQPQFYNSQDNCQQGSPNFKQH